jgi:ATP-dependent exoDNAse (exonuclease V) beta subunit
VLPHARAVAEGAVEEERRLAYVGITRARDRLVLSYCQERPRGGGRAACHPSRFIFELAGKQPPAGWKACDANAAVGEDDDVVVPKGGVRTKTSGKKPVKRVAKTSSKAGAKAGAAKKTSTRKRATKRSAP